MLRKWLLCGIFLNVISFSAIAQITFDVVGAGSTFRVNFNQGVTAQRTVVVRAAAQFWADRVSSSTTIVVDMNFIPLTCSASSAVLGSAGTQAIFRNFNNAPLAGTFYSNALANSHNGSDLQTNLADIVANFNTSLDNNDNCLSGRSWDYSITLNNATSNVGFYPVLLHEFSHGLGFQSFLSQSTGNFFTLGTGEQVPDSYSINLRGETDSVNFGDTATTSAQRLSAITDNGNLTWIGPEVSTRTNLVTAGTTNGRMRMFAPSPLQPGSSVSHFDTVLSPNALMEPRLNSTLFSELGEALFLDIGWRTVNNNTADDNDADGIANGTDNCPNISNADQLNTDGDSQGNACDLDDDNDQISDEFELANGLDPLDASDASADADGDGENNLSEFIRGSDPNQANIFDIEANDSTAQAQDLDGNFTLTFSADIGDETTNTSTTAPHVTVFGSGNNSVDYFRFTVDQLNSNIVVDIDRSSGMNSSISLSNSTGVISSSSSAPTNFGQSGSFTTNDAFINSRVNQTGTFTVLVGEFVSGSSVPNNVLNGFYQLHISIVPPSTDASLSAVSIEGEQFSPAFSSNTFVYTSQVVHGRNRVNFSFTPTNSFATTVLIANGSTQVGSSANLNVGVNTLQLLVTADDTLTQQSYTFTVTRNPQPTVAIISAVDISSANSSNYIANGSCSENGQTVTVAIETISNNTNCSNLTWSLSNFDVSAAADGTLTLTVSHADALSSSATPATTMLIKDVTGPVITTPSNLNVEATGVLTTIADIGTATALDARQGVIATVTPSTTGPFAIGVTTVTWTATDNFSNSGTATQIITVTDSIAPIVTAPSSVTINANSAITVVTVQQLGTATALDMVDGNISIITPTINGQLAPFSLAVGSHTVTWTAVDSRGNVGSAAQQIQIVDIEPPVVTAPTDVTIEASSFTSVVNIGTATALDSVDGVISTVTASFTGPFPVGSTVVIWTAIDTAGNVGTATQQVTITDTTAPVVTAPTDLIVEASSFTSVVNIGTATALDNVDGVISLVSASFTGPFPVGSTVIVWTATDSVGNVGTATQQITITDTTAPVVTAPAAVNMEANSLTTVVNIGTATAIDNVDGVISVVSPSVSGPFPVGSTVVVWTATDSAGNIGTATQLVTVTDSIAPVVAAPAAISMEANSLTTIVNIGTASAIDNIDGVISLVSASFTGPFPVGSTVIVWTAIDTAGNVGTATQQVTITDTTAPVVTAPTDVTIEASSFTSVVNIGTATALDSVDGVISTVTASFTGPFPVGSTVVIWTAIDTAGNVGTATQQVTITDTTAPVVTAPTDLIIEASSFTSVVNIGTATALDNVDGVISLVSASFTGPFPVGSTVIVWTATDSVGNVGTATQQITITDTTAPVVTAPAAVNMEANSLTTVVNIGTATAIDNVDGVISVVSPSVSGPFPVGSTVVVWTATDSAGNIGTATQLVTVTDSIAPVVAAPAAISMEANSLTTIVNIGTASAIDNIEGVISLVSPSFRGPFPVGSTVIVWSATDSSGNVGTATQQVTITDSTGPVVSAPFSFNMEATGITNTVNIGTATAVDSVDGAISLVTPSFSGPFPVGSTVIVWTATDSAGNVGTATQQVTVVDTTAPVVTAPSGVVFDTSGESVTISVEQLGIASASDIVDGVIMAVTPTINGQLLPATVPVGNHVVTWTAVDKAGNSGTATQNINIIIPELLMVSMSGPERIFTGSNVSLSVNYDVASNNNQLLGLSLRIHFDSTKLTWQSFSDVLNTNLIAQDAQPVQDSTDFDNDANTDAFVRVLWVSLIANWPNVDLPTKLNTVNFEVANNQATGTTTTINFSAIPVGTESRFSSTSYTATITDSTAPVVTAPLAINVEATGMTSTVNIGTATAVDSVDGVISVVNPSFSGPFAVGSTVITWTATDRSGNVGTATQQITVVDTTAPLVTAPLAINIEATGMASTVNIGTATAVDSVDGVISTVTASFTGPFPVGSTVVIWTAIDTAGNVGTATQQVTITDTTAPVVTAPAATTIEASSFTSVVNIGTATALDSVDGVISTVTASFTGPFPVGSTVIIWTAMDTAGNVGTATQQVTVVDTAAPVVTAPSEVSFDSSGSSLTISAQQLGMASASDLVDGVISAITPTINGQSLPTSVAIGNHVVTWTAVDNAGNAGTATQNIQVIMPVSQLVSVSGPTRILAGTSVSWSINYAVANNNNQLQGLALRVHFNSNQLLWQSLSNVLSNDLLTQDTQPILDTADFDNDASTDVYLMVVWNALQSNWPNVTLPTSLYNINFQVASNQMSGATTTINFSAESIAPELRLSATAFTATIANISWDIDGNQRADALTDGLLMLRYLFGFRGQTLINGAVASDATFRTATELENRCLQVQTDIGDIDGDGRTDALTDGLLLLRYLFGFRGETLINGAVSSTATRTTAAEIENQINLSLF